MKEIYIKTLAFFDRKFFYAVFAYLLSVAVAGEFAGEFRESHIFAGLDRSVSRYFLSIRFEFLTIVMKCVTFLGDAKFVIALVIFILAFLTWRKKYVYSIALVLVAGVSFVTSFLLKDIFARPRPQGYQLVAENDFSFPSGHAIIAVALYGLLTYFLVKHLKKSCEKTAAIFAGFIVITAIGVSRVYLGVHWPSDVIGSYILGGLWLAIVIYLLEQKKETPM